MWRRQLTLPPSVQLQMSIPLESLKAELRKTTNIIHLTYVLPFQPRVMLFELLTQYLISSPALWNGATEGTSSTTTSSRPSPKPIVQQEIIRETVEIIPEEPKKKKKPKWWQFWKRIKLTWGDD